MRRVECEPTSDDILSKGRVQLFRQRADLPFTSENTLKIETKWSRPSGITTAFQRAKARAAELEASHPIAWNADFGYITPDPRHCGTALNVRALVHLEALHLIGDLEVTLAGLRALRIDARGIDGEGMRGSAHLYRLSNAACLGLEDADLANRLARIYGDLAEQELSARFYLTESLPRVFDDAISRALAILRGCRLLNPWEFLDLVSPLRLAAQFGFLDGLTREEALQFTEERLDLEEEAQPTDRDEQRKRDTRDAALADFANERFENVRLNARGKRKLS